MKIGFTLDEKVFDKISPKFLIEKAEISGISSIEISPDKSVLPEEVYKDIVNTCTNKNIDIHYHIPYFAHDIYELEYFTSYKSEAKKKYMELLSLLENLQEYIKNVPTIVIHGSKYKCTEEKSCGMDNTLNFIDWFLNTIEQKNLNFKLGIETLRKKGISTICDNRDDIYYILNKFQSPKLGVCWDICHDNMNFYPDEIVLDDNFLEKVIYCHIHGIDLKKDISHISLIKSDINYSQILDCLSKNKFEGSINIEILSNFCEDSYIEDLFKDINYLNNIII
ncbi:xylose isomerase-like TIM barrel domain-containing protein [Gottschalkia purinilytica]|uniref:Xylose isomerase-like TIM barrel domain-containing protein n=1 Tax=Gottschalkia purinilytica TaxID=1503 RepID=A0A0L0WCL2_GOTPU|nr:TIM barrel protein [Gottschalkia purinilytica]KNF09207.1 xylose isomerase-like TIM barrel domain-containing protein [Gottschalkia purinilytica]